jgi:hypothetical protein
MLVTDVNTWLLFNSLMQYHVYVCIRNRVAIMEYVTVSPRMLELPMKHSQSGYRSTPSYKAESCYFIFPIIISCVRLVQVTST